MRFQKFIDLIGSLLSFVFTLNSYYLQNVFFPARSFSDLVGISFKIDLQDF